MAELFKVNAPVRKPLFEGVQGENEARSIQFDITPWVEELGDGAVTATAKRSQDSQPYPVTVTKDGNIVTWKPTSTDTAYAGVGSFQLEYTVDSVLAKTCIWSTMVAPSLDPAGDPPDPYDNWLAEMRQIAADALQDAQDADASAQDAEAWAVGQRGGVDVPSTDPTYENNAKYWAEQSLANQYGAFIVKSASGEIASFSDGADDVPMKSVNVTITPKQSGSGDPSPSNVRPISGWTDAGINISPYEQTEKHTITGKNLYNAPNDQMGVLVPCHIDGGVQVVISETSESISGFRYYDANKQQIDYWTLSSTASDGRRYRAFTTMRACEYVEFYGAPGTNFMVETGVYVPSPYEPYGYHTPVPLGQTVYGGEVDVTTGALKTYPYYSSYNGEALTGAWVCDRAVYSEGTTPPTGSQVVDMSGTVATTVQLTPAQIASLLGTNNVWSDAGSVEVEYRADPTLAYAELEALILENI